jgi:tRNA1Val (adenine37-N6)-methyltransferase
MLMRKPFAFKQFEIEQSRAAMPVTTDACVFGALSDFINPKSILDIGAGTGVLSLMLAQRFLLSKITAIEPHEGSYLDSFANFKSSPFKNRMKVLNCDLNSFDPHFQFDAIICNPPFFHGQLPSISLDKRNARHSVNLTFETLLFKINQLLTPLGQASLLIPTLHQLWVRDICTSMQLFVNSSTAIKPSLNKAAHLVMFNITRHNIPEIQNDFITFKADKIYSKAAINLLKPFYSSL